MHTTDGEYTEARKKLHQKIREGFLNDVTCIKQNKPIAILTGGAPGSGKSHFIKNFAPYLLSKDIFHIDADEVRTKIPEYAGWNAQATHFEVRDIVNEMIDHVGGECHYDLIYDGTMNKAKKYYDLINKLKAVGYDVFIIYLDIPQEISQQRVLDRYQRTGRFVPMDIVQEVFDAGHEALDQIKSMVSGYVIVDGLTATVTATGGEKIPQDRNYKQLTETTNFIETSTKDNGDRSHKIKIAKAKASSQLQRIRILQIAKLAEGGIATQKNISRQNNEVKYSSYTIDQLLEEMGMTMEKFKEYGLTKQDLIKELSQPSYSKGGILGEFIGTENGLRYFKNNTDKVSIVGGYGVVYPKKFDSLSAAKKHIAEEIEKNPKFFIGKFEYGGVAPTPAELESNFMEKISGEKENKDGSTSSFFFDDEHKYELVTKDGKQSVNVIYGQGGKCNLK